MLLPALNSASELMQNSARRFDLSAANLANINTDNYQAQRIDGQRVENEISSQMVESITSADSYKLGVALMRTGDEMLGSLVNIKA